MKRGPAESRGESESALPSRPTRRLAGADSNAAEGRTPSPEEALASWPDVADVAAEGADDGAIPDYFEAEAFEDEPSSADRRPRGTSQATELIALARGQFEVIRGDDGRTYAVARTTPGLALALRGKPGMRERVSAAYFDQRGRAATGQALSDMLTTLEGDALRAEPVAVHLRVASVDSAVYVHLGAADSARSVEVDAGGWRLVDRPPVTFRRSPLANPLPEPVRGGSLDPLRALFNVSEPGFRLLIAWLLAGYLPTIPHPILALLGQQGTAKTTAMRMLLGLLDPSPAGTRSVPRDEDSWVIPAMHSWAFGLDNVSSLPAWLQDALCKAVTGDGIVRRAKFTDDDVTVLTFRRVIALTSISPGALQGDVADRLLPVELDPIEPAKRRTQRAVDSTFGRIAPEVLGALFDLLALVLVQLPHTRLDEMPRMADFARLLAALDAVTGWTTLTDYLHSASDVSETVIEADAFAAAVRSLVEARGRWSGTARELLDELSPVRVPRVWPTTPEAVSSKLKRMTPAFAEVGIVVAKRERQHGGRRGFALTKTGPGLCSACGLALDPVLFSDGMRTHPTCGGQP